MARVKDKKRVTSADRVGLISLDAGGTSGLAWGLFDLGLDTVAEAMQERERDGSCEVTGTFWEQADQISEVVNAKQYEWQVEMSVSKVELVIEDFILRVGQGSSDPSGLMSVRVAACLCGVLGSDAADRVVWQMPSTAKKFGTKERLKNWDCWVRGSEHQRDAWRHMGVRVANLM